MELLLEVSLVVVIFSGTKMWSSKRPDHQVLERIHYSLIMIILIVLQRKETKLGIM